MAEVRVMSEGVLRWVQASGSGSSWATGATPASGVFGFVRSFSFNSAARVSTISDRGVPNHHKVVGKDPVNVTVNLAWTGTLPTPATAAGASVPMVHLEYKSLESELGGGTGRYFQFYGLPIQQVQFTEGDEDTMALTLPALGMSGANSSGYLS